MSTSAQTSPTHKRIADQIGSAILCGQWAAGSVLPKEMGVCADLKWAFHSGPSVAFIQEMFELRGILEPHAAELAARRRTVDHLALMSHALAEMGRHGFGTEEGRAAEQRFHEEILVATGNQALKALSASIGAAIHWTTVFKYRAPNEPRDAMPEHRKLYAAIVDCDAAGAAEAARELIQLALQDTRASLRIDAEDAGVSRTVGSTR